MTLKTLSPLSSMRAEKLWKSSESSRLRDIGGFLLERVCRGLLECFADRTVVGVFEIRSLHHEDVGDAFDRIGPCLRAVGTAMAEGAGREHRGHTLGYFDDAGGAAPVMPAGNETGF